MLIDWVRLKAGYTPPHWTRGGEKWDAGYQNTAYFLEWVGGKYWPLASIDKSVKSQHGELEFVQVLNLSFRGKEYHDSVWKDLTGKNVEELWEEYEKVVLGRR